MVDIYEIRFKDNDLCTIKICQEDELGNSNPELNVCLRYNDSWDTVAQQIDTFLKKHPKIMTFNETMDSIRMTAVYHFVSDDGSKLTIDAISKIKQMDIISKIKKEVTKI